MINRRVVVCVVLALAWCARVGWAGVVAVPPILEKRPIEQALADNREAAPAQLLFVVYTPNLEQCEWCGGMLTATWSNPTLAQRVRDLGSAVLVELDMEDEASEGLFFAVVVYRAGEEIDRWEATREPIELRAWFDDLAEGRTRGDALRERAADRFGEDGSVDIESRFELLGELMNAELYPLAADESFWLLDNTAQYRPDLADSVRPYLQSALEVIVAQNADARARVGERRSALESPLDGRPQSAGIRDWLLFNAILGEDDRSLGWIYQTRDRPGGLDLLRSIETEIGSLLMEHEYWGVYGSIIGDPAQTLRDRTDAFRAQVRAYADAQEGMFDEDDLEEWVAETTFEYAGVLHAALLAAGREDDAWAVVAEAKARTAHLEDSDARADTAAVYAAQQAGVFSPKHRAAAIGAGMGWMLRDMDRERLFNAPIRRRGGE